ncbi:MAG: 2Fe-2S iron-sulfur cluster-binding protein [Sphaerochaetaceae bacterium]
MKFSCHLNNKSIVTEVQADESLRSVLVRLGCLSVRDSDDGEGFAGSDTVLVDNLPVFANLLYALEAEGAHIRTAESLANKGELSVVQQALIDAGVVGSAYKAPAAALLLTWLLERDPDPTKEAIKETLSGLLIRDSGYEHYFLAIQLAKEYAKKRLV